jgi:hypothetical protein
MHLWDAIWIFVILSSLQPAAQKLLLAQARRRALAGIATSRHAKVIGLPVRVCVPDEERPLMDLYPQPRGRERSVEYMPRPPAPPGRDAPRGRRREASAAPTMNP